MNTLDKILCLIILDNNGIEDSYIPLIDHPHNDKENGQSEIHYHADTRYLNLNKYKSSVFLNRESDTRIDLPLRSNERLEYKMLKMISTDSLYITHVDFISNSKLKHKCMHKGKCPHRGYDLSKEKSKNGIIICPLHGLQFNEKTKQLIENGNNR